MSRRQRENAAKASNENRSVRNRKNTQREATTDNKTYRKLKQHVMLLPKNLAQETYIDALENAQHDIVFAVGNAGTGKTWMRLGLQKDFRKVLDIPFEQKRGCS